MSDPSESPVHAVRSAGFALLEPPGLAAVSGVSLATMKGWTPLWEDLPRDGYLKDGGAYRARRHSCFVHTLQGGDVEQVAHRAHWQSEDYNALHGGMERWFEPLLPALANDPAFLSLLRGLGNAFAQVQPVERWFIEAHQFRIDTAEGIGRPTPEGAHRDGVDFVAVILVQRSNIRGGETRVFDAHGPTGWRFEMQEPWTALLLDDAHVIHESTPIRPVDPAVPGARDTLVLTFRKDGFQAP